MYVYIYIYIWMYMFTHVWTYADTCSRAVDTLRFVGLCVAIAFERAMSAFWTWFT